VTHLYDENLKFAALPKITNSLWVVNLNG